MSDLTVVTHNGNFHADDVFSIAVLKHLYPSFNLVRTRDKALMDSADIVIDVGGQYDPDAGRLITTNVVAQGNVKMEYRTRHLDWCGKSMV